MLALAFGVGAIFAPASLRADDRSLLSRTSGFVVYGGADAIDAPNV